NDTRLETSSPNRVAALSVPSAMLADFRSVYFFYHESGFFCPNHHLCSHWNSDYFEKSMPFIPSRAKRFVSSRCSRQASAVSKRPRQEDRGSKLGSTRFLDAPRINH